MLGSQGIVVKCTAAIFFPKVNRDRPRLILVPRAHDPSGLWQESRALAAPDFLSMRRVLVSYYQPIRFAGFDGKFVNRGLPVLDKARALDLCRRPERSWALGTRMEATLQNTKRANLTVLLVTLSVLDMIIV